MAVDDYLFALGQHAAELLDSDTPPPSYPTPLAAAVTLAADRLAAEAPAAHQLLMLCAYLAPEPIPLDLFADRGAELPPELSAAAASPVAVARLAGHLTRFALARPVARGLQLHCLTQAVLRDVDPDTDQHRQTVEKVLIAAKPESYGHPAQWPRRQCCCRTFWLAAPPPRAL